MKFRVSSFTFRVVAMLLAIAVLSVPMATQAQRPGRVATSAAAGPSVSDNNPVVVAPTIIDYQAVKDNYRKSTANRNLVIQVTVSNSDPNSSLQIFSLAAFFDPTQCQLAENLWQGFSVAKCETVYRKHFSAPAAFAPKDLRQIIAEAQIAETNSLRSRMFRGLDAVVLVGSSIAVLNGGTTALSILSASGIPALRNLWPDMSPAQMQRIVEHGTQPVLIGPGSSQTFVIFLPASMIFTRESWALYTATAQTNSVEALEFKRAMQLFAVVRVEAAKITRSEPVSATSAIKP